MFFGYAIALRIELFGMGIGEVQLTATHLGGGVSLQPHRRGKEEEKQLKERLWKKARLCRFYVQDARVGVK